MASPPALCMAYIVMAFGGSAASPSVWRRKIVEQMNKRLGRVVLGMPALMVLFGLVYQVSQ